MSLKLTAIANGSEIALNKVEYIEENDVCYFRVSNSENIGVNFLYVPITSSKWDKDKLEIHLFKNPYLNAENDVFQVYEATISEERLGWIFPITILESNENDFRDHSNLNQYKYIAYQKLFELDYKIITGNNFNEFLKLSDVFGNIIICILCKETTNKIKDFKFENYLLSFYKYGYLINLPEPKAIYNKTEFVATMRNNARVTLTKANFDITTNDFTKSLFIEHLLQSDNFLVRFILLYQIIEHFIDEFSESQFNEHIKNYQMKQMVKNDFREAINRSATERDLIVDLFNSIPIQKDLINEFITEVSFLYSDIGKITKKNTFPDKMYNIRNLVTHNLRELTTKTESMKKITELFELIILDLLINFKTTNPEKVDGE